MYLAHINCFSFFLHSIIAEQGQKNYGAGCWSHAQRLWSVKKTKKPLTMLIIYLLQKITARKSSENMKNFFGISSSLTYEKISENML